MANKRGMFMRRLFRADLKLPLFLEKFCKSWSCLAYENSRRAEVYLDLAKEVLERGK